MRDFLRRELPAAVSQKVKYNQGLDKSETVAWIKALQRQGWAAPNWPQEHGGCGWSLTERQIFDVECRAAHAPYTPGASFNMVGPAIIKFGTPEQQARFLPPILSGDEWWCQGYSEPGAGSDLASLRMQALRDGDDYRVTGQKIWTSGAEHADWIFVLVRTNNEVQAQKGISFLLVDLSSPGVRVEPLYAFNGKRLWNQVFFDDVRVPVANRLGEQDRGWTVAKNLLGDERLLISRVAENRRQLSIIREHLHNEPNPEPEHLRAADQLDLRLQALEITSARLLTLADEGAAVGAEPSMLKLKGSELVQAMDELLFRLAGYCVLPSDRSNSGAAHAVVPEPLEFIASGLYHHRGYTIAGGSTEIQRNIIAKQVLGL